MCALTEDFAIRSHVVVGERDYVVMRNRYSIFNEEEAQVAINFMDPGGYQPFAIVFREVSDQEDEGCRVTVVQHRGCRRGVYNSGVDGFCSSVHVGIEF